jgi:hypothetical protein
MKVKNTGYDGIETSYPPESEKQDFLDSISKFQLAFIGLHWETSTIDFEAHKVEYADCIRSLA